jgi:trimeric autotransporter adhesin
VKSKAVLSRVVVALALVATACGSASDLSNDPFPSPEAGVPAEAGPIAEAGPSVDAGPDAADAAADAPIEAAPPTYIKASNTHEGSRFGIVALDGDTLAVGALGEASAATTINGNESDRSAPLAGAVYVFKRAAGTWTQQAYLKASNNRAGAAFGVSLALKGDTLAVGALYESSNGVGGQSDTSAPNAGAVYVFKRTGTTWAQEAYLKASNARAGAEFGTSVALSGDMLAVGSASETSNATGASGNQNDTSLPGAGAAYVFTRSGAVWTQQAYLKASNTHADALFGSGVSLEGNTLAVGALHEASGAKGVNGDQTDRSVPGAGAAYVFTLTGTTWSQQAYLKSSNTQASGDTTGGFSIGLSLSGDTLAAGQFIEPSGAKGVNGDQNDTSAINAGAVYVFNRTGTSWSQQAYLKASNPRPLALFGYSVALSGNDLIVGSVNESSNAKGVDGNQLDTSAPNSGAAYRFKRTGTAWAQQAYLKATNTREDAIFGYSVAAAGDTFAVGSVFESSAAKGIGGNGSDTSAPIAGAVYVYR